MLVAFADPLFSGRVFFYRDLGNLMHPVLSSAVASTRLTESVPFAFWTHLLSSGRPLLANPGYALLAPLSQLYWLPFDTAFNLFLVGHALIGSLGMAFLARRFGASPAAAFAAGAAYGLGGGMISSLALYWTVVSAGWAPWVLVAGHAVAQSFTLRRVALLALALGLQAMGGQPEPILATILVGAAISLATADRRSGAPLQRSSRVALAWGMAGLWGIAVAAVHLVPAVLHARTTARSLGFTVQGFLYNSLDPRALPGLILPRWGGSPMDRLAGGFPGAAWTDSGTPYLVSCYLGLCAALLAIVGVVVILRRAEDSRRVLVVALGACALLGVTLALGSHLPGLEALLSAASLKMPLRYPVKALFVTFLAVPPLTALGIDLVAGWIPTRRAALMPILLALVVVLDLTWAHRGFAPTIPRADLAEPPLALQLKARAVELGAGDNQWRVHHERLPGGPWSLTSPELEPTEQEQYLWRRRVLLPPIGAAFGIHHAMEPTGDVLDDLGYAAATRAAYQSSRADWARGLGRAGVLFVLSPSADLEQQTGGVLRFEKSLGAAELVPAGSVHLYRNEAWRPRAFLSTGRVWSVTESPGGLRVALKADRAGELLISDALGDLGAWRASVDGADVPLRRAEGAFVAIDVPQGAGGVELTYVPRGVFLGLIASVLAVIAALVAIERGVRVRPS